MKLSITFVDPTIALSIGHGASQGVGVVGGAVNTAGHLLLTLSSGTVLDVGSVVGPAGSGGGGGGGVTSFNGRTGTLTLSLSDVTAAVGFTPYSNANPAGYVTASGAASAAPVQSVAGRTGAITLAVADVAGAAPTASPALTGTPSAPTAAAGTNTTQLATTAYVLGQGFVTSSGAASAAPVQSVAGRGGAVALAHTDITDWAAATAGFGTGSSGVTSFNGRTGVVTLSLGDVTAAVGFTPYSNANPAGYVTASGAASASPVQSVAGRTGAITLAVADVAGAAPTASPVLTGMPSAPTAAAGTNTTQLATTAYVLGQGFVTSSGAASAAPVQSVAGRTGAITLAVADVAGAAPTASPVLTGMPSAPTAAAGTNTTQLATTAYVLGQGFVTSSGAASAAPVQSVAGRTGAITLAVADVAGAAPTASPALTGTPSAPTAAAGTNTTQLATTAYVLGQGFVTSSGAASAAPVQSVAGRTGAITLAVADVAGAAPAASPALTGTPSAPTAVAGTNTTQLATTAYVLGQGFVTSSGAASAAPVQSVAGRTGAITLAVADVAGAAPTASPALTGTPTAPTATIADNSTKVATTAFVAAAIAAVGTGGLTNFAQPGVSNNFAALTVSATPATATSTSWSISGGTLTIGGSITGTWAVGMVLGGTATSPGWIITGSNGVGTGGTGTGGAGTYTLNGNVYVTSIGTQTTTLTGTQGVGVAMQPTSGGGVSAQVPTGTIAGGNARGAYAADFQTLRTSATQVASGGASFTAGCYNTASGFASVALGSGNTSSGNYGVTLGSGNTNSGGSNFVAGTGNNVSGASYVLGNQSGATSSNSFVTGLFGNSSGQCSFVAGWGGNDRGRSAAHTFSSSPFGNGDAGSALITSLTLRGASSSTSATRLTADGSSANTGNVANLSTASSFIGMSAIDRLTVIVTDTVTHDVAVWYLAAPIIIKRVGAYSTTALVGTPSFTAGPTTSGGAVASASAPTMTADTTNGGINLSWTATSTNATRIVARVDLTEVF